MKNWMMGMLMVGVALLALGCVHKAYLGMHGRSIKLYPEIHASVVKDLQCLDCHHPDNPEGPATPHPDFKGCIKCHND